MRSKRSHKQDKLAKIYDAEILPIWSKRFGRLFLRDLALPPKANVLDVGCGTGYPALEILRRMDDHGRIIAIDPSSPMLDVARDKAGALSGRRIFFRSEGVEPRLSFADDVYDLVVSNLALQEMEYPPAAVREFARVTKPSGRVIATLPLAGTFGEFYDIYREVLVKKDLGEALARLDDFLAQQPDAEAVTTWLEEAGLVDVAVEAEPFTIHFRSSREFFYAPLIDFCWLSEWRRIAGDEDEAQDVLRDVKESIDAYFGDQPFSVSVIAGAARGRKPTEEEARLAAAKPKAPARAAAPQKQAPDNSQITQQIELGTSEIEMIEEEEDDSLSQDEDDLF